MSEPLSSTEIEDVLSSIRRLVSDDMRPSPRAVAVGDKLILTPALRVVQAEVGAEGAVTRPAEAAVAQTPVAEAPMAEMVPPLAQTTVLMPAPDAMPMFVAVPRVHLGEEEPLAVGGAQHGGGRDLGGVVASVGAAVDAAPDDWEAEIGDTAPQTQDVLGNPWSMPQEDAGDFGEALAEDAAQRHDHFEYEAETAALDMPGWAQQDGSDESDAPAVALHGTVEPDPIWADEAEASVIAELAEPDPRSDDAMASEEDEFNLGMRFDEDVLRELVRDMLREELAGKMGERITRNIRKLVRAEIARALAAQEFE
ncbi:hypothetical protein GCM10010873_28750 [Cypionkella aquatica]|uniref:Uncharacterized protein n=1 Tax=Cypionkella aquatica TaxID=1756042 RepID=A0AA37U3T5_9RHOB|nr:hypothetical protein [Cypionkella aquatica]GLS87901.1 hypothetical protein GCM10010873_28750 [Cypionkella aquatica]